MENKEQQSKQPLSAEEVFSKYLKPYGWDQMAKECKIDCLRAIVFYASQQTERLQEMIKELEEDLEVRKEYNREFRGLLQLQRGQSMNHAIKNLQEELKSKTELMDKIKGIIERKTSEPSSRYLEISELFLTNTTK